MQISTLALQTERKSVQKAQSAHPAGVGRSEPAHACSRDRRALLLQVAPAVVVLAAEASAGRLPSAKIQRKVDDLRCPGSQVIDISELVLRHNFS